ncbi:MAG: hypothetical protein IJ215_03335 [Clostridia bacterium]|nr:hypothetical protein [Clostridia bacterium]
MAAEQKKKVIQNIALVIISIVIIIIIYFIVSIVRLFQKPVDTVMVKKGELINYEEVTGYIIRDEEIVDTTEYDGTVKSEMEDATRVSRGSAIMTFVSKSEQQIVDKIAILDEKIDKAIESKQTIFTNDVKALDAEIETSIYSNIKENHNLNSIKEYKKYLNEKIEKKAKIVGELSPAGSELKNLMNERTAYEKELNDSEKLLLAPKAGLVSYRVDNLENVLTSSSISTLTSKDLSNIKVALNQVIPVNLNRVKIIDNFECYIAVPMKSKEAYEAKLNDTIYLRFKNTGDSLIPATVEYISKEEDCILLVFKLKTNIEELTKYRKIGLDVVWWSYTGLKVSKDTIFDTAVTVTQFNDEILANSGESSDESGEFDDTPLQVTSQTVMIPTVTIKKPYGIYDVFVKVLRETSDFVIIDNYKDSELLEMGISEEVVAGRNTIKMYDECVVQGG